MEAATVFKLSSLAQLILKLLAAFKQIALSKLQVEHSQRCQANSWQHLRTHHALASEIRSRLTSRHQQHPVSKLDVSLISLQAHSTEHAKLCQVHSSVKWHLQLLKGSAKIVLGLVWEACLHTSTARRWVTFHHFRSKDFTAVKSLESLMKLGMVYQNHNWRTWLTKASRVFAQVYWRSSSTCTSLTLWISSQLNRLPDIHWNLLQVPFALSLQI